MAKRQNKQLILAVIDAMAPAQLEATIAAGQAPVLQAMIERGTYSNRCVSAFPSVTPVCAATIATGVTQEQHLIPGMNWYHRGEQRYVEYGTSLQASRTFGVVRSLSDTIYNMNLRHLNLGTPTVFESLDDAGVRTAGTTYLIYRGRFRHEASTQTALSRLATTTIFRHATYGPRELFYADLFASRKTACRSQLGLPGLRDQHAGCVGEYLIEHDLFDFLLLSLPDNDSYSHKYGPAKQVDSIARADHELQRLAAAAGGVESFLDRYAVVVVSDHAQSLIEEGVQLAPSFASEFRVFGPGNQDPEGFELAVCPCARAGMVYLLGEARRGANQDRLLRRVVDFARDCRGVDLLAWFDWQREEVAVVSERGELRFALDPAGSFYDPNGGRWRLSGDWGALRLEQDEGLVESAKYPNALARLWAAATCRTSGEVLLSAKPGYEFADWGGMDHVGGGSHGALDSEDSNGVLITCGLESVAARTSGQRVVPNLNGVTTIADVTPLIRAHYEL